MPVVLVGGATVCRFCEVGGPFAIGGVIMPQRIDPPSARLGDPDWRTDGRTWPNRDSSTFWQIDGFTWHVQKRGVGPSMLLLHGTGAGTHSWTAMVDCLQERFETISVDLPGHGFTQSPIGFRPTLRNVSRALLALLSDMDVEPACIVGHSAGAAIALTLARHCGIEPNLLVSINGALKPFDGMMRTIAPLTARAATFGGLAAWMVSRSSASPRQIGSLVAGIGSDPERVDLKRYSILLSRHGHIQGALSMMANWDLTSMMEDCRQLSVPVLFIAGEDDRAVASSVSAQAARRTPKGSYLGLQGLGHLAHEESPKAVAEAIMEEWDRVMTQRPSGQNTG